MPHTVEPVVHVKAEVGEGPIWDYREQCLWWIDIVGQSLFRFDPDTGEHRSWALDEMPGTVVVRAAGGLMMAVENGFAAFDPETGAKTLIAEVEAEQKQNRFNDGKCDPQGRFWAGTMHRAESDPSGALYSLDTDHSVTRHFDNVTVSNGIVWTRDATTMYYIDSNQPHIFAFDYRATSGQISNRRVVFDVPREMGAPDGMAIDANDKLWVGFWGGWCVGQICPIEGKLLSRIELPCAQVTACAFGGRRLDELYMTTAAHGLDPEARAAQPLAGSLFVARLGIRGVASDMYRG